MARVRQQLEWVAVCKDLKEKDLTPTQRAKTAKKFEKCRQVRLRVSSVTKPKKGDTNGAAQSATKGEKKIAVPDKAAGGVEEEKENRSRSLRRRMARKIRNRRRTNLAKKRRAKKESEEEESSEEETSSEEEEESSSEEEGVFEEESSSEEEEEEEEGRRKRRKKKMRTKEHRPLQHQNPIKNARRK